MTPRDQLHVRVPAHIKRALAELATELGCTQSDVVIMLIERELGRRERETPCAQNTNTLTRTDGI